MQVIGMGRWSKADKDWKMVVALRQPASGDKSRPTPRPDRREPGRKD